MKTYVDDFEGEFIEHDTFIDMKCIHCGYEEKMPEFVYAEEAEYLRDIGDLEPPCFHCIKCHKDTLYRKGVKLPAK